MRVLYVSHTGRVGGAERSLIDLLTLLPPDVEPVLACPAGRLGAQAAALGVPTLALPELGGLGRGAPVAATRASVAALALRRMLRRTGADVVHAASIRAGVAAAGATVLRGTRLVVDIRDCPTPSRAASLAQRTVARAATVAIANSGHTATAFRASTGVEARVVHPLVDLAPLLRLERARDRAFPALAVVGQLTPWKAQDDAIAIAAALRREFPEASLTVAGDVAFDSATSHDNRAFSRALRAAAGPLGGAVGFLGEVADVAPVLAAADVVLVPSWEEPFGRVVVEAMAAGALVVATDVGGPAEIVRDGVDGLLLPPRRPDVWARALADLLRDDERRASISAAGREHAGLFQRERVERAAAVLAAYVEVQADHHLREVASVV